MTFDPKQELSGLQSEQAQLAKNYEEAKNVMQNCQNRLLVIKGSIDLLEKMIAQTEGKEKTK